MSDEAITIEDPQVRLRAEQVAFVREALCAPRRDANATIMVLLLVAFVFVTLRDSSIRQALVLIGVLLFHESGHLVGMRLFGFTDLRMFFLPGFGAAASGRKPGASAVQHAIVSLAGPLPGILLALPLLWLASRGSLALSPMPLATEIVWMLALLNALNLAPLLPFDGGRFFAAVLPGPPGSAAGVVAPLLTRRPHRARNHRRARSRPRRARTGDAAPAAQRNY